MSRLTTPSVGLGLLATAIMIYKIGATLSLWRLPAGSAVVEAQRALLSELGLNRAAGPSSFLGCDFLSHGK